MAKGTAALIAIGLGRTRAKGSKRDPQRADSTFHPVEDDYPGSLGVRRYAKGGYAGMDDSHDEPDEDELGGPSDYDEDDIGSRDDIESQEPDSEEADEGDIDESAEHERLVVRDLVSALGLDPKRVDLARACEAIRAFHDIDEARERRSMGDDGDHGYR